jgi:type III secretory pathway component EscU
VTKPKSRGLKLIVLAMFLLLIASFASSTLVALPFLGAGVLLFFLGGLTI